MRPSLQTLVAILVSVSTLPTATLAQSSTARSVGHPRRPEVTEMLHCLKAGDIDWLANSPILERSQVLHIGLVYDKSSYPGPDHIVVVILQSRARGDVFDLTRTDAEHRRIYRVENNGEFEIARTGLRWPGEALGGNWTHEYLERNIRRVMIAPKIRVRVKDILKPISGVACDSYLARH